MKSVSCVLIAASCLVGVGFASPISNSISYNDHSWNFLVFSQIWPGTKCRDQLHSNVIPSAQNDFGHECKIPDDVSGWTIHGLWPSVSGGSGPFYCNDSWPFSDDDIQSLIPDMKKRWPNYFADESADSLWKHEWTKHGTCASSLSSLYGEKNYFGKSLNLNTNYNLDQILGDSGIKPNDDNSVDTDKLKGAINKKIGGHDPTLVCFEGNGKVYLYQIEICLNKEFDVISCQDDENSCGDSVMYPEIHHE